MKTITEIKDQIAQQHGYKDFLDVLKSFDCAKSTYTEVNFIINESMQEYAKQCCDLQIEKCADNATAGIYPGDYFNPEASVKVDKESILSTPNVAEKP